MSVKVMNAVFDRFPEGGGIMVLALKLADHAHDDGSHIYPSVDSLAMKTRQSDRTVQRQLEKLVQSGWLIQVSQTKGGRGVTNEYRISPAWLAGEDIDLNENGDILSPIKNGDILSEKGDIQSIKGDICDKKGDTAMSPEQSRTIKNNKTKIIGDSAHLPEWLPLDAWDGFIRMRKAIKKPLTDYAMKLAIAKLAELRAEGNDPSAVLNRSILNSWQGLFPLRDAVPGIDELKRRRPRANDLPAVYQGGKL